MNRGKISGSKQQREYNKNHNEYNRINNNLIRQVKESKVITKLVSFQIHKAQQAKWRVNTIIKTSNNNFKQLCKIQTAKIYPFIIYQIICIKTRLIQLHNLRKNTKLVMM